MTKTPGNKVLILGLGKSGFETAKFLHLQSHEVFVSEQSANESSQQFAEELTKLKIPHEIGKHSIEAFEAYDWAVVSPGIKPTSEVMQTLQKIGIPIFSEIEVASWFSETKNIIAITGTAGKTTVTSLLGKVLAGHLGEEKVFVCGNIGNPWIREVSRIQAEDFVVLELSSFQLANCEKFKPKFAALLNLSENHLDWHPNMNDYVESKLKIFENQSSDDFCLFREEDEKKYFQNKRMKGKVIHFGVQHENPNHEIVLRIAYEIGCDLEAAKECVSYFEGIEHRLEGVALLEGIRYVNDSKCTTTASLAWALKKFEDKKVILIAGGKAKSDDFDLIRSLVAQKTKLVIFIGDATEQLKASWTGASEFQEASSLDDAVKSAQAFAQDGDVVLLSPACASFDMFRNYEDRGNQFKSLVSRLQGMKVS